MELFFKGKEFVYNHHLTVPFRPLVPHPDKSIGNGDLDGNLIIHGDNLHALKSLLPRYAGKVDCIFIDPPYNTGKENWCYNDNVNSPIMREWLSSNPVNREDMLRHDKWCAMMWPRLKLLHELLADDGSIWVSCDDNEIHRLRSMLDEIFGDENLVSILVVENNRKGRNDKENIALTHEYMIAYSRDEFLSRGLDLTDEQISEYSETDPDGHRYALRDLRKRGSEDRREDRESMFFPLYFNKIDNKLSLERISQHDIEILPLRGDNSDGRWRWGKERVKNNLDLLVPRQGTSGRFDIDYKVYLTTFDDSENEKRKKPKSVWFGPKFSTDHATNLIKDIFGNNPLSHSPKPLEQIVQVIQLAVGKNGIILDSFAGSGTTAHAVLEANRRDDGNRNFILVECEDYADALTAERVRRIIRGYSFAGKVKEEILCEKINWTKFQKASELLRTINGLEALHSPNFNRIKKEIKDGELIVYGEKDITKTKPGLGGSFTFCTLGDPVDLDALLTGENLPNYDALGAWVFYTATNQTLPSTSIDPSKFYLGESPQYHVWLIYKPDMDFLKSNDCALTLSRAETISKTYRDKKHLVFAPVKFVPNKTLLPLGVEFAQLPYAIYRREQA
ncbi:Site-specific DNA-methyltransferase (adenine-specific) [Solidesulfovibrio fructosivorans JJ]]|uniref:site-specific DNA-methyltransferase (adenine-specific) n=1 Tax=Solidesulfovibrio fructosivorans JJ] TaxID=596151 RepID=E1JT01_SOLFR|nr:site-specific DNA-methyltransferase [Solidesulfovibrio fructosivorans]EFL52634.1 Site-specific DNA-methyltransferase (adenine-specific) [Solidesulfovibrio fructosivorans JJ]]